MKRITQKQAFDAVEVEVFNFQRPLVLVVGTVACSDVRYSNPIAVLVHEREKVRAQHCTVVSYCSPDIQL